MRILYVHHNPDLYGASRSLLRLVRALDSARFEPVVVVPETGPLCPLLEAAGAEVVVEPRLSVVTRPARRWRRIVPFLLGIPLSALALRRLIGRRRIELVHANTGVVVSSGLAARLAGVPHVWHIRDSFQEFPVLWRLYSRYVLATSRRVIAVSRAMAAQFRDDPRVTVIPNGVAPSEFPRPDATELGAFRSRHRLEGALVVGCVGRLKLVRKGQETLLAAAALLKRRGHRARFLFVGAPYRGNEAHLASLEDLRDRLGLRGEVVFAGELHDPRLAYAVMDVFVLPSAQPEPFAGVVLEAMAMSLPVVATRCGGSAEQVVDGVTGVLVEPADPEALADAIEPLLRDEPLRRRMGAAGLERVVRCFSPERMAERIQGVYFEAAFKKRASK